MTEQTGAGQATATESFRPLTAAEHRAQVVEFNDTAAACPADQTIVQLFEAQVARTPADEAVRFGSRSLTYAELNGRANQIAAHLAARGVRPDQLVTLYMEHSLEVVAAILGVLKAGAAYAPVDPTIPPERLAFMLQDISAGLGGGRPLLITHPRLAGRVPQGGADVVAVDEGFATVAGESAANPRPPITPANLAYVIYTSGSTGKPKGVMIEHRSLVNYIWWASGTYCRGERLAWPLFSSLAFDLTVTSIFTPLVSGGRIVVYCDDTWAHGTVILRVVEDNLVDIIKLTPAHLTMIKDLNLGATRIRKMILGGEDFKTELAKDVTRAFGRPVDLYNEYGPTEATVGCMIHRFDIDRDRALSVPIGVPIANAGIYVLDEQFRPVPPGVTGEMYLAGAGLARGYFNRPDLTAERFRLIPDPRVAEPETAGAPPLRAYRSGDLARWTADGRLEFLGRADHQVKIGGARVELGEIEARLLQHPVVRECAVTVVSSASAKTPAERQFCSRCGVASNFPGTRYDAEGVCNWCRSYDTYKDKAQAYFKTRDEFHAIVGQMKAARTGGYDCIALFSGGKDSTFMLYKLFEAGLKPLAFSLDNGYISEEAKANIRRVTESLGVDLHWGTTPHMNEIFVDSLKQFSNVCNGCFKTIYTLAINLAKEKDIRYIVTGLSRGQFFETRLTEEVFRRKDFDAAKLDALVLEARKAYHQRQDAVSSHIDIDLDMRGGEDVLDSIEFVDFYRYWSVPLEELYATLHKYGAWSRPSDTGRSTNCLINDLGIYLHKKQRGFHNYSLPYGWDVRLEQKTREEAMEELEDEIDEARVRQIMAEIGYVEPPQGGKDAFNRLAAYYVSDSPRDAADLRAHLAAELPDYMLPTYFVRLEKLPLTPNGKVDRQALPAPTAQDMPHTGDLLSPQTETEKSLAAIWTELLQMEAIGVNDSFFELGGHSLLAIRAVSRIREAFDVDLPFQTLFANPTIATLAKAVDEARTAAGAASREAARKQKRPTSVGDAARRI